MSAISWELPEERLNNETRPSEPTGTATRFGTVCPCRKFRLEASGFAVPGG